MGDSYLGISWEQVRIQLLGSQVSSGNCNCKWCMFWTSFLKPVKYSTVCKLCKPAEYKQLRLGSKNLREQEKRKRQFHVTDTLSLTNVLSAPTITKSIIWCRQFLLLFLAEPNRFGHPSAYDYAVLISLHVYLLARLSLLLSLTLSKLKERTFLLFFFLMFDKTWIV